MATKKSESGDAFKGRRSKVDPFSDIVGTTPDKEVAVLAGVSPENVRTWRKRRGIPASWKTGDAPAAEAKPKPAKRKTRKKARRRKSKLDPFRKELGKLADREIAEKAGTTVENVRAYRKRHRIAAQWREAAAPAPAPAPAPAAVKAPAKRKGKAKAAKPVPAPVAPKTVAPTVAAAPRRAKVSGRGWAFRVTAEVAGVEKQYVTFGGDVVEAAQYARDKLIGANKDAFVQKIEVIGVAL